MKTAQNIIKELQSLGQSDVHVLDKRDADLLLSHIDQLQKENNHLQSLEIDNMNLLNRVEELERDFDSISTDHARLQHDSGL